MKKFRLDLEQFRAIFSVISIILLIIFLLFVYAFFSLIYQGIEKKSYSDYNTFCYALFAANAIMCNSLLAFGRSQTFIDRSDQQEKNLIYFSSCMFLYAALIGFFLSGWIYVNTDVDFNRTNRIQPNAFWNQVLLISLAIGLGICVLFSIAGLVFFVKWSLKASSKLINHRSP